MASLWFHMMNTDVYTNFSSLEESYFFCYKLFTDSEKYSNVIEKLQTQYIVSIGSDPYLQVSIYYGTSTPPLKQEWFPNGLIYMTKDQLKNHIEYKNRCPISYELKRTISSTSLHELCEM
jgi:hypothetical protein